MSDNEGKPDKTGNKKSLKRKAEKELSRVLSQTEFDDFVEIACNSSHSDASKHQNLSYEYLDNIAECSSKTEQSSLSSSLRAFKHYVYGRRFKVEIDNKALFQIKTLDNPGNRVTRQILKLQEYDIEYVLIKSKENLVADLLSRQEIDHKSEVRDPTLEINNIAIEVPSLEEIQREQWVDPETKGIIDRINSNIAFSRSDQQYRLEDNLLVYLWEDRINGELLKRKQIVIPSKYRPHVLNLCHAAHYALKGTYDNLCQYFFWKGMYAHCRNFVDSCLSCNAHKYPNKYAKIPLQDNIRPEGPLNVVSIDIVGPVRETSAGFKYILVVVDLYTRFIQLYALKTQKATEIADRLLDYVSVFGLFDKLLSDCATNFQGAVLTSLAKHLGVKQLRTTPYSPATNGINEKSHASIKKCLAIFARENGEWNTRLNYLQLLVNSQKHTTLGYAPYFVMFGRKPILPCTVVPNTQQERQEMPEYVENRLKEMNRIQQIVTQNVAKAAETQQNYRLAVGAKLREFKVGQKVFLHTPNLERSNYVVKRPLMDGPYVILKKETDVNYTIIHMEKTNAKPQRVHVRRLLGYTERLPELNLPEDTQQTLPKMIKDDIEANVQTQVETEDDDFEDNLPLAFLLQNAQANDQNPQRYTGIQHRGETQGRTQYNTNHTQIREVSGHSPNQGSDNQAGTQTHEGDIDTEYGNCNQRRNVGNTSQAQFTLNENTQDSDTTVIYDPNEQQQLDDTRPTPRYNFRPRHKSNQKDQQEHIAQGCQSNLGKK
ncbi:hypothetical protein JTE90_014189 [Oedothorax gibbosus]|uniref:RNA-directed DNA polymerase n=1 Tax=Oedothorax gibbosus TaxID=931172 RepID=A0AAV6TKP4_9ARAC|nr:hypothetical protein JTE90_014189 [Oedothorax gibbosus]